MRQVKINNFIYFPLMANYYKNSFSPLSVISIIGGDANIETLKNKNANISVDNIFSIEMLVQNVQFDELSSKYIIFGEEIL